MALGALLLELLKRFLQKSALDDKVNDCTQQHHQKGVVEVLLTFHGLRSPWVCGLLRADDETE